MTELLQKFLPAGSFQPVSAADGMPTVYVPREQLVATMRTLRDTPELRYAFLADITAVDFIPREPRYEVVYLMASLGSGGAFGDAAKRLRVKVRVPGTDPSVPTLTNLWKAADWAERELWDMFGIRVDGHADLRRILMPEDWEGHPGRRDYPVQIKEPVKVYEPLQVSEEEFVANIQASRDRSKR
ncbi:MAG: NADH-quinone oxidoreductase subunit C [Acidobacteriota bacterium]|nr:NADH-quinone oxidoreductase subunit C [Acidobacteriota bacterium]